MNRLIAAACVSTIPFLALADEPLLNQADNPKGLSLSGDFPNFPLIFMSGGAPVTLPQSPSPQLKYLDNVISVPRQPRCLPDEDVVFLLVNGALIEARCAKSASIRKPD